MGTELLELDLSHTGRRYHLYISLPDGAILHLATGDQQLVEVQ